MPIPVIGTTGGEPNRVRLPVVPIPISVGGIRGIRTPSPSPSSPGPPEPPVVPIPGPEGISGIRPKTGIAIAPLTMPQLSLVSINGVYE